MTARSLQGEMVRVYLPPHEPNGAWRCGTRWVWQMHPNDVHRLNPTVESDIYVCEHAIELD